MPKQASLHKINGKADGRSYYYSQNGGWLSRTINPGMSERVKTAPEFANTRRNGKEFGSIGMFCGGIVRSLTNRWRFILDPITTGKYVKDVYTLLRSQAGVWGQRVISSNENPKIYPLLNKYSKNALPLDIAAQFTSKSIAFNEANVSTIRINGGDGISLPVGWGEDLAAKGADKVQIMLVSLTAEVPIYNDESDNFTMGEAPSMTVMATTTQEVGVSTDIYDGEYDTQNGGVFEDQRAPAAIGLIVLPMKTVGSNNYVMQELCSFHCLWVSESYTPEP